MKELRIGLVGTGSIGKSHIDRINNKLHGAKVVACSDPATAFGMSVAETLGLKGFEDPIAMINDPEIDAVICTAGDHFHEQFVLASIAAGKYIFCEKPLSPKPDACRRIVDAEIAAGKQLVQVGFMRRYDTGYRQLKEAIDSREYGEPLLLHCAHRNMAGHETYETSMAVENSMIHEIDVLRWLLSEDYTTAEVRFARDTRRTGGKFRDPQIMILTTESGIRIDVEAFINNGHSYEIKCEVVCEDAVLNLPEPANIQVSANGRQSMAIHTDWITRFADAYDVELQCWINGTLEGRVDGPNAWDGYVGQVTAAAASLARDTQTIVPIVYDEMPELYR